MQSRLSLLLILALGASAVSAGWWFATQSSKSRFLPAFGDAEWILYPVPPETNIQRSVERNATFRRTFTLDTVPSVAQLQVRAFERCRVQINGRWVKDPAFDDVNWKQAAELDTSRSLQRGPNQILVTVTNSVGPPVLWLSLKGNGWSISSDERWEASLEGAVNRSAVSASAPLGIRAGNTIAGGEWTARSFVANLRALGLFAATSCGILGAIYFWNRRTGNRPFSMRYVLIGASLLWLLLFWNNLRSLSFPLGFDVMGHLDYIRYIQEHKALPLADQGWAMHHPPLYHLISAAGLSVCGLSVADPGAAVFLRLFSLALGIAQVALVFGCLRLVFPDKPTVQNVGLLLCAFLPAQIYLYHFVTNESLATTLGTAVVYVCLRILRDEQSSLTGGQLGEPTHPGSPSRLSSYLLLGTLLGAALLTKVTAIMLLAVVVAVLAGRLLVQRRLNPGTWLKTIGSTLLICFAISGWHYGRVWAHFGTPLVGNYDPASGFTWWQDPGCSTSAYYWRFGHSLIEPYFSGFNSFGDGIYSTLWCDALWGGVGERPLRPPWNYDLMAAGCLLAIVPTVIIFVGAVSALVGLVRRPRADWFLLCGLAFSMGVAVFYQCLRFPYYGHAKVFYALAAVVSLCAFAAAGFEVITDCWRGARPALGVLLGVWAMAAFASFWVDHSAATTQAWIGTKWKEIGRDSEAALHFQNALRGDPKNVDARLGLVDLFAKHGNTGEASRHLLQALHDNPDNAEVRLQMAKALQGEQPTEALKHAERAVQLAPDHIEAYRVLGSLLDKLGRTGAAIDAYRHGLANIPTSSLTHRDLAALLARTGKPAEAIEHYRASLRLRPDKPVVMDRLAWILATQEDASLRNAREAIQVAEEACQLTAHRDPVLLDTLAAAYAEAGRFDDAKRVQETAFRLASASGPSQLSDQIAKRLKLYAAGKAYHETRPSAVHGIF
jgi:tetratricopeptide (TPR) repeat protein